MTPPFGCRRGRWWTEYDLTTPAPDGKGLRHDCQRLAYHTGECQCACGATKQS